MLIVTRKFRERLKIGTVTVVVLGHKGKNKLRIGVEGPDIAVRGEEIFQITKREQQNNEPA